MKKAIEAFEEGEVEEGIPWTTASPSSSVTFANGINYKLMSSPSALLGITLIEVVFTEIAFMTQMGWAPTKIKTFFTKARTRVETRLRGNYYGRVILDSSPYSIEENPIDDFIVNEAPKSSINFISNEARWDNNDLEFPHWKDEQGNPKPEETFYLFKGNGNELPSVVEPGTENHYEKIDLIPCPLKSVDTSFIDIARDDPIEYMRDYCAKPTNSAERIFYNKQIVEDVFVDQLKNHYYFITAPAQEDPEHLIWNQVRDIFFYKVMNTYKFWYAPEIPRTLAIDQSISEDMASITLSHTERDLSRKDSETGNALTMYVSDFTLCIVPIGGRINLDAIKLFVMDLINLGGMKLAYNSTDRFQSEATVQYWKRQGLNVEYLSVDRTNDPYLFYVNMVQRGRVKCGRNIILKNNMLSIQMKKRKAVRKNGTSSVKIDHMLGEVKYTPPMNYNIKEKNSWKNSWNTCTTGNFSKDVLDSQVASIELLRKYSMIPYKIWNQEEIRDRNYDDVYEGVRQRAFNQGFLI